MRMLIALLFVIPGIASAMSFSPASPGTSAFMNSNTVDVTTSADGWLGLTPPGGTECRIGEGTPGYNWGIGSVGTIGASGSLYTYFDGSGAHSTDCSPYGITDYSTDGEWYMRVYSDETFSTVLEEGCFYQGYGSGCSTPPTPGPTATTTIEQILTQIHFDFLWLLFLITFICGILYFERYYKA